MSYLIAGSSKVKIALTISKMTRDRIDKIMARTGESLTDVVNDLLIAGLDATHDLELHGAQEGSENESEVLHELGMQEGLGNEAE